MAAACPLQKAGLYVSVTGARPDSIAVLYAISGPGRWTGVAPGEYLRAIAPGWARSSRTSGPWQGGAGRPEMARGARSGRDCDFQGSRVRRLLGSPQKSALRHSCGHVFRATGAKSAPGLPARRSRHRRDGDDFGGDDRGHSVLPRSSSNSLSLRMITTSWYPPSIKAGP